MWVHGNGFMVSIQANTLAFFSYLYSWVGFSPPVRLMGEKQSFGIGLTFTGNTGAPDRQI
jgi:hypothetical protein